MCLAVPTKIIRIEGDTGWVGIGGCRREVRLDLIDSARVGDYVLVHAGFAIHKIDEQQAEASLKLLQGYVK
jgi:hydrogenase expression/formation protein HypC